MPKLPGLTRWSRAVLCIALMSSLVAACSFLIDHEKNQCDSDADCVSFGGHPSCQQHVCVETDLGPEGCFFGTPSAPEDFANQCSRAQCEKFDNCAALGLCGDAGVPPSLPPPDAPSGGGGGGSGGGPIDAPSDPLPPCVDPAKKTIVVGGSTAVQPFMQVVAKLLANAATPYQIAYQPSGSCAGVDNIFNPAKQVVKDLPGKQAILYHGDTQENCTFGTGAALDVAVSDVFASSCTASYSTDDGKISEYRGPIQPMTFVVSTQAPEAATVMSAEYGHFVFGRPTDAAAKPYGNPALHFIRNAGSGTQQMISRAIGVEPGKWWGLDQGSSGKVASTLEAIAPASAEAAIGILSTDFADAARQQLRVLAFKNTGQICGYYPDSTPFLRDKANVRDGHYNIWGPVHFYARTSNGQPSEQAGALVTQFVLPRLEDPLLDAITDIGFVPPCAMKVKRTTEMGPLSTFEPDFQCSCYYENRLNGKAPDGCQACVSSADCPDGKKACNKGFCEKK